MLLLHQVAACTSLSVVGVSTITFILSTLEEFQTEEESGASQFPRVSRAIQLVDNLCTAYFALEYFLRLACSPRKLRFLCDGMNTVDLAALIPLFLTILLE